MLPDFRPGLILEDMSIDDLVELEIALHKAIDAEIDNIQRRFAGRNWDWRSPSADAGGSYRPTHDAHQAEKRPWWDRLKKWWNQLWYPRSEGTDHLLEVDLLPLNEESLLLELDQILLEGPIADMVEDFNAQLKKLKSNLKYQVSYLIKIYIKKTSVAPTTGHPSAHPSAPSSGRPPAGPTHSQPAPSVAPDTSSATQSPTMDDLATKDELVPTDSPQITSRMKAAKKPRQGGTSDTSEEEPEEGFEEPTSWAPEKVKPVEPAKEAFVQDRLDRPDVKPQIREALRSLKTDDFEKYMKLVNFFFQCGGATLRTLLDSDADFFSDGNDDIGKLYAIAQMPGGESEDLAKQIRAAATNEDQMKEIMSRVSPASGSPDQPE